VKVKIQEINVQLKAPARKTINVYGNGKVDLNIYQHRLLKLTSKVTSTAWAIDITGAQYYINQPTHQWETYVSKYVTMTGGIYGFGMALQFFQRMSHLKGLKGMRYSIGQSAMKEFNKGLELWSEQSGIKLSDVANLNDEKFSQAQKALLQLTHQAVSSFVAKQDLTMARIEAEHYYDLLHPEENTKAHEIAGILGPSLHRSSCTVPYSVYLKENC
jgi:hypothetical protein